MDARFGFGSFARAADREALARSLEGAIVGRLLASADPAKESKTIVEELRALGHDLRSFDESLDFQAWCADWTSTRAGLQLVLEIDYPEGGPVTARVSFQQRG